MGELRRGEPQGEAVGRFPEIDRLVDEYVKDNNHALQGWGDVVPKPALKNPERLRQILYRYAARNVAEGGDEVPFALRHWIAELAAQETVFQDDFDILDSADPRLNCVMYVFRELGIKTDLKPHTPSVEVRKLIDKHFEKVAQTKSGERLPLEAGDVVLIEDGGVDGWHVALVEKIDDKFTFRSKLGELFVVRNESLDDLNRLYTGQALTLYRKK